MHKLTLRLNESEYADLVKFQQKLGVKTISNAVKNAVNFDASRAGVTSFPINKESIYEDSSEFRSCDNSVSLDKNKKTTPPRHLDPTWLPPGHLREDFCKKYGIVYHLALELFREIIADENRRSANWPATWALKVKKGQLRQRSPEEDEIQPEDTMAYQLGNAGCLNYLART